MTYRCWAEISLDSLRHNARVARERVAPGVALLAVIKANAYGHGLVAVGKALTEDVEMFGVANLQEATEAREAVSHPILILGPALPEERAAIVEHGFIPSISSYDEALAFSRLARRSSVAINLKIDTGMGRMGILETDALAQVKETCGLPNVEIHSVSTHLPSADEDAPYTRTQLARFAELVRQIRSEVPEQYKVHALLSAGILSFSESAFEMVRAGLMLYGVSPVPQLHEQLQPVMTLKTRVVLVRALPAGRAISYGRTFTTERPTRVATLSVGYADGYPRALSNRGAAALIGGHRCSVLGRVTMDLVMVDVTDVPGVAVGDEAVLIGRQNAEEITTREVAERASTIPWEIFTGIGSRVPRVYL